MTMASAAGAASAGEAAFAGFLVPLFNFASASNPFRSEALAKTPRRKEYIAALSSSAAYSPKLVMAWKTSMARSGALHRPLLRITRRNESSVGGTSSAPPLPPSVEEEVPKGAEAEDEDADEPVVGGLVGGEDGLALALALAFALHTTSSPT